MKRSSLLPAAMGMLLLILDSRCAAQSARDALELCLRTVIPSLFPMFVLSGILVSATGEASGKWVKGLEMLLDLPAGGGILFLLGILGGFPVGAQCITQAVGDGQISRSDGEAMLGFCNNCSPAFLFGIAGSIFSGPSTGLLIFLIQLETALLIASVTKFESCSGVCHTSTAAASCGAIFRAIRSMSSVCAWVILAGVAGGFLKRWVYPLLPGVLPQIVNGLLEITGGILGLSAIEEDPLRFVLCSSFVCFGGFSVWMQIASVSSSQGLSTGQCFRQKTLQGALGVVLSVGVQAFGWAFLLIIPTMLVIRKITLEKSVHSVYNDSRKGGLDHVVS